MAVIYIGEAAALKLPAETLERLAQIHARKPKRRRRKKALVTARTTDA